MEATSPGDKFARLTAIRRTGTTPRRQPVWLFRCDCGGETERPVGDVRSGHTRSCGCLHRETTIAKNLKHGHAMRGARSTEHRIWLGLIQRCENPNNPAFKNYGGRGISVCPEWRADFQAFLKDVGPRPGPEFTIDRIDNAAGYEPGNVRWATDAEQRRNKRNNRMVEIDGERLTLTDACARAGVSFSRALHRLNRGWPVERVLS